MSKIVLAEQSSAPDTPGSGKVAVFVDTNGDLAWKDDAGNVIKIAAAGSYTLTIPATGTAALLGTAQTFSAVQTFSNALVAPGMKPAADSTTALQLQKSNGTPVLTVDTTTAAVKSDAPLTINTAISTPSLIVQRSGTDAVQLNALSGDRGVAMPSFDNAASYGPYVNIGRNSNASTPASGHIIIRNLNNQYYSLWVDASANLRIVAGAQPTNATDTGGTVVGTQTSMAAAKHLFDDVTPIGEVLASIQQAAAAAVKRFTYRSGAFNGEAFEGVVTDLAPRYGMDRDDEHPAGKSLNEITLLGDLVRAVAWIAIELEKIQNATDHN